jgi:hypothetical protein
MKKRTDEKEMKMEGENIKLSGTNFGNRIHK